MISGKQLRVIALSELKATSLRKASPHTCASSIMEEVGVI